MAVVVMVRLLPTFLLAALAMSSRAVASSPPRGVAPASAHLYQPTAENDWKCLNSSKIIPATAINDDYCDCEDGSDEPGTSACPVGRFYCANEGHIPAYILTSRVNDGLCDPECCDGSDEYDGKVHCGDTCAKVGREYRKKKTEEDNKRRAGAKVRAGYITSVRKSFESTEAELAKLEVEVTVAGEREAAAKRALEVAEDADKGKRDVVAKLPLHNTVKEYQDALRTLQERQHSMRAELRVLTNLLDDLAKGYNPNYQDMAVKGAVVAYKEWRRDGQPIKAKEAKEAGAETSEDEEEAADEMDEPNHKLDKLTDEKDLPTRKVTQMYVKSTIDLLMEGGAGELPGAGSSASVDSDGILFRIHEYLPDALVPYFEALVDTLLDLLLKANVIKDVRRTHSSRGSKGADEPEPENVIAARAAHNDAKSALRDLEDKVKDARSNLETDVSRWGKESEFRALKDTCVERNFGEYTYEYCFFGQATQKPNKGGGNVSLGSFEKFDPEGKHTAGTPAYYLRQRFDRGQRCWNGPDRSALVDLVCDTTNALLDVFEAEKCIYSMKVSTPAVCVPLEQDNSGAKHEEL